jgi:hypothetical protein
LTRKDKQKQYANIKSTRKNYKKGIYINRKTVKSFVSKPSKHIVRAIKLYGIEHIRPSVELAKKTGCSLKGLNSIVGKGMGAYYSSGSRPNQTPESWGYARLASSITGNKASKYDYAILEKECTPGSKALSLATKFKKSN